MPKVCVTGGEGFLGSHVCQLFARQGWEVVSLDNRTRFELMRTGYNVAKARYFNTAFLDKLGVNLIEGDIRNYDTVWKAAAGCDYLINCAAQPAMTVAMENPKYDADVNIMGTLNVLRVAQKLAMPAAICSTIHVYGAGHNKYIYKGDTFGTDRFYYSGVVIQETDETMIGDVTPLHVSKYTTELYARAFVESYGSEIATFRLTGIYGPRQLGGEDHGWVANFAIRTILGLPIKVFGTDKQVRDILYVTDAAEAFWDWYKKPVSGVYNVGGGPECITSLRKCLAMLKEITDREQKITAEPERKGDLWYFCSDVTKATDTFGWKPKTLPQIGIVEMVEWIEENEELFEK